MSEEVRDAARSVPRAMIAVYFINFALVFPAVVTFSYHIVNVEDALADPTLYPVIYVLRQAMSHAWMTVILTVMLFLLVCSNMTYLAAVTRDMWAFARDQGLPFSNWIAKIDRKRHIPTNAIIVTSVISILLSLIYIGSSVAFYAITSLLTVALLQCYCLSIGCLLWRRITHPETLPPAKFPLGKLGIPLNILAIVYSLWCFFWAFWPTARPVTAAGFNWASVIFVGVLIGAAVHFIFIARKKYIGPVAMVRGRQIKLAKQADVKPMAATSLAS
jgi:choline transport protein